MTEARALQNYKTNTLAAFLSTASTVGYGIGTEAHSFISTGNVNFQDFGQNALFLSLTVLTAASFIGRGVAGISLRRYGWYVPRAYNLFKSPSPVIARTNPRG